MVAMNPLAEELNATIKEASPALFAVLSQLGRGLFFPKGILTQTAEAREKANKYDATIGIARESGHAMNLKCVMDRVNGLSPDQALDYAPSTGNVQLRRMWSEEMYAKNPSLGGKSVSLPVVTGGITHGLTIAGEMFLDPGDVVLLPDKYWGNYNMVYGVRRGAEVRRFPLFAGGGFNTGELAFALSKALDEKGKALVILNFPNNPTGYSIRAAEADAVVEALTSVSGPGREVVVVLDDAYFGLFYTEDALRESLFGRLADASEHVFPVKLDGVTKEEYAWGLRVGFITFSVKTAGRQDEAYAALEKKVGGAVRGNISNCSQLSQSIVLAAMSDPDYSKQKEAKYDLMRARASKVLEVLENPDFQGFWKPYPFNAGYFMSIALEGIDAEQFRVRLLDTYGVGVIAEGPTDIRVAFSCLEIDEIEDLFDIMYRCARDMREGQKA
jgi:aspartate/methionine/tyrosine aminotransferase